MSFADALKAWMDKIGLTKYNLPANRRRSKGRRSKPKYEPPKYDTPVPVKVERGNATGWYRGMPDGTPHKTDPNYIAKDESWVLKEGALHPAGQLVWRKGAWRQI